MPRTATTIIPLLIDVLAREEAGCRSLLETLHSERAAIRSLSVSEFPSINDRRVAVLQHLGELETERGRLVGELADTYGVASREVSLQHLMDRLSDDRLPGLREQHAALSAMVRAVREEIVFNVRLIEGARGFLDHALASCVGAAPRAGLYASSGRSAAGPSGATIIRQQG